MESTPQGIQHLTATSMGYAIEAKPDGTSELQLRLDGLNGALYQPPAQGSSALGSVIHLHQEQQILRFTLPSATRLLTPTPLRQEGTIALFRLSQSTRAPGQDAAAWQSLRIQATLEICRRITLPFATAALLLLGIGLGFGHPRFYKGGAILRSMGMIMLYYLGMKYIENMWIGGKFKTVVPLLVIPIPFLVWGWFLLNQRLRPHHPSRLGYRLKPWLAPFRHWITPTLQWTRAAHSRMKQWLHGKGTQHGILRHWSTLSWWSNWASALGSLLLLNFLIEYASLAGDLSKNRIHFIVFIKYWTWNLPPFLAIALPMAFLLGSLLALSEAALSREWLALRAGGVSLLRWIWSSRLAWAGVTAFTFLLQIWVAPMAMGHANRYYRQILKRSQMATATRPWLYLGSTGVLWNLQGDQRWGFPLKAPGEAPLLLAWRMGDNNSQALAWGGLHMVQGPPAERLFPERSLRDTPSAEEASTYELVHWQRWAPDPERAYMLWSRLLGWLAGPCLVLAMLSYAFPGPRQGRGQALGAGLVAGLLFLGLQALFGGAARASEIPATWGVLAPLLLLLSVSLFRLRRLRT
jgi:lipopolysaccharide export LptBFGC system permease protein LptF